MRGSILLLTIVLFFLSYLPTCGQKTFVLSGNVTDVATGQPMPFANVYINGSTQGAVTDENGAFTLAGIPLGTVEIVASFVGYQPEKRALRFENSSPQKANFQLKPSVQMLDAVTVRGNPKRAERHLRQFKKQLFGEPFGGQCVLVNSEVLSFKEEKDHLFATASEPLIIENQALGYRVLYDLQHFDAAASGKVLYAGAARFEELKPENEKQAERFRRNRLTAYKGSIRHLMASLIDQSFEQAGFLVYQDDATKPVSTELRALTLASAVSDFKRLIPVQAAKLIQPGRLPNERRLVSNMKLIIFYTKATSSFSPYPDARYAYTEMKLPRGQLQMSVDGMITMPEGMEAQGSMGNEGLSSMLPAEWKVDGSQKEPASGPMATHGKLAPPDTSLARMAAGFEKRFKILAPALFVHIDKPFYATGDLIWLSTYLLDPGNHQRPEGETAMHVDLLTSAGKLVQHQWIHISDGRGQGHFRLSDTLASGTYRLRAYTDEDETQRGPAFERSVAIYNLLRNEIPAPETMVSQQPDIQILPEGGRWISGLPARLGVKIVQADGRSLPAEGRIVDDLGAEIARFRTNQQGMTSVSMQPKPERNYFADVTFNNQLQHIPLPKPEQEGLLLSADVLSDTTRLSLTLTSTRRAATDSAYLLIQQRGQVVDQRKILLQDGMAKVSLPMTNWLPGLAQVTIYDATGTAQAERLIFVPEIIATVQVTLALNKNKYQPREQVVLSVNLNDNGTPAAAALSASVTDIGKVPEDTADATLQTHLLLTGELRGRVENPNQYLTNRSAEMRKALDDLLLTQGWRRVSGTSAADSLGGVSIMGRVLNAKNRPVPDAQITFISTQPGQSFLKTTGADENGRFRLAGLAIADTVQLMAQVADRKSKTFTAKEAFVVQEALGKDWKPGLMAALPDRAAWKAQLEAARVRQEANAGFYRDKTAKDLNEVTVRTQRIEERPDDVQMRSLHTEADAVVTFNEKSPAYANLYEMMQGRFPGVTVTKSAPAPNGPAGPTGYTVFLRGGNSYKSGIQPLYLMDGVPIQDPGGNALLNFNPRDIERIEVLKNAGTAGIYGMRGGNGVIAFYTKRARSMQANVKARDVMTPIQVIGYPSVHREFYVPRYDAEATTAISGAVDDRDVLYWKPLMQTDMQGRTQLRFPLSDVVRTLRVVIQGVTNDGRPVAGVQFLRVQ